MLIKFFNPVLQVDPLQCLTLQATIAADRFQVGIAQMFETVVLLRIRFDKLAYDFYPR